MNIIIYTNILTPYRKHFYDALANDCQKHGDTFHVILMAETEPNRNWHYDDFKSDYTILLQSKTISIHGTYIHINRNLIEVLIFLKPDVVICAGSYLCPGIWTVLRNKDRFNYKVLFWSESHLNEEKSANRLKIMLREEIRKEIYMCFDGFWYAGKLSKQFIEKYASEKAKYFFVPNTVEEVLYQKDIGDIESNRLIIRNRYGIDPNKIILFCPARLTRVKGIDKIIPIIGMSKQKNELEFVIAGEGELKNDIERIADEHCVDCKLLGYQDQNSVADLYSACDYFLLPSISDPNPLSCIEALWAGLPLIISNHCGNYPEVIEDGINGFVFSYEDIEETTNVFDTIQRNNTTWYKTASLRSRQIAMDGYCTENIVVGVLAQLRQTVAV